MVPDLPGGIAGREASAAELATQIVALLDGRQMYLSAVARELGVGSSDQAFKQAVDELARDGRIERYGWGGRRVRLCSQRRA